MSGLARIFPGISSMTSGGSGSGGLTTGGNPLRLNGNEKGVLAKSATMPAKTSRGQVTQLARQAGEAKAQSLLFARHAQYALAIRDAAIETYKTRVDYSRQAARQEVQFQRLTATHAKTALQYGLDSETNAQELTGYEAQFAGASRSLNF